MRHFSVSRLFLALWLMVSLAAVIPVPRTGSTAPGDLDPAFGSGGLTTASWLNYSATAEAVTQLTDGKLLVAGSRSFVSSNGPFVSGGPPYLARFSADGVLDTAFGQGGRVALAFSQFSSAFQFQPDGKLLVGGPGNSNRHLGLARYQSDGQPDPAFGSAGQVTGIALISGLGGSAQTAAIFVQPDGKIVVAGNVGEQIVLARLTAAGLVDTTFGTDGARVINFLAFSFSTLGTTLALQPDGKILVGGCICLTGETPKGFAIARLNNNGSDDLGFGSQGRLVTGVAGSIAGIALQPDGTIVAAGSILTGTTPSQAVIARYLPTGVPDPTFGLAGVVTDSFLGTASATSILSGPAGSFIIVGSTGPAGGDQRVLIARFTTSGERDTSFGKGGFTEVDLDIGNDQANRVSTLSDGRLLAAGFASRTSGNPNAALVRTDALGEVDIAFGKNGILLAGWENRSRQQDDPSAVRPAGLVRQVDGGLIALGTLRLRPNTLAAARVLPDGRIDSSYGEYGWFVLPLGPGRSGIAGAIHGNGDLVLSNGALDLVRVRPSGRLETAFGSGGLAAGPNAVPSESSAGISISENGHITAGSVVNNTDGPPTLWVRRTLGSGAADPMFGVAGVISLTVPAGSRISRLIGLGNGTTLVGLISQTTSRIFRFLPGGQLDPTFGSGGILESDLAAMPVECRHFCFAYYDTLANGALLSLPDGRILQGATRAGSGSSADFQLRRFEANGRLDVTFGNCGTKSSDLGTPGTLSGTFDGITDLAVLPDGRILAAGFTDGQNAPQVNGIALARFLPNGARDVSFGSAGVTTAQFAAGSTLSGYDGAHAMVLQPDGKAVVVSQSGDNAIGLARFLTSGGDPQPEPIPTPTPIVPASQAIYGDTLLNGWINSSWDSSPEYLNRNPIFQGTASIAWTASAPFAGFKLTNPNSVLLAPDSLIEFVATASAPGIALGLLAYEKSGQSFTGNSALPLADAGGNPPVGGWQNYRIRADRIGAANRAISGIALQSLRSTPQPAVYLDEIRLTNLPYAGSPPCFQVVQRSFLPASQR